MINENYNRIKKTLPSKVKETLELLQKIAPTTARSAQKFKSYFIPQRFSDLQKLGLIKVIGTEKVGGSNFSVYDICTPEEAKENQTSIFNALNSDLEQTERALNLCEHLEQIKTLLHRHRLRITDNLNLLQKFRITENGNTEPTEK